MMSEAPTYLPHVARGDGGDDELGHADRQARAWRASTIAVPPEPAAPMMPAMPICRADPALERHRHAGHRRAAIAGEDAGGAARMKAAIWCGGISAPECLPDVDRSTMRTGTPSALIDVAHEAQLVALGVERAGDQDHLLARRRQRPQLDAGRRRAVSACRRGLGRAPRARCGAPAPAVTSASAICGLET